MAAETICKSEWDAQARLAGLGRGIFDRKQFDNDFATAASKEDRTSRKTRQEFRREVLLNNSRDTSVAHRPVPLALDATMPWGKPLVKKLRVLGRNKASRDKILARVFQDLDGAKTGRVDGNTIYMLASVSKIPDL